MEDLATVQDQMYRMLWNRRFVTVPDAIEFSQRELIIANPTIDDRNIALHIKDTTLRECKSRGVLSEKDVLALHKKRDYWTDEDEEYLRDVDAFIADLEKNKQRERIKVRQKKYTRSIVHAQERKAALMLRRNDLWKMSAEYMAHEAYLYCLLQRTTYLTDDTLLWPRESDFLNDHTRNPALVFFLCREIIEGGISSAQDIRAVARSVEWRLIWTANRRNLETLFKCPPSDLNNTQKLLVYWSRVYDSVYEDPERPEEDVIQDDDRLDDWLIDREEGRLKKHPHSSRGVQGHQEQMVMLEGYYSEECTCGVGNVKVKGHGERPRHAQGCPWGTFISHTEAEKAEIARQVYGRNSNRVRQVVNKQHELLDKHGVLKEQQIRNRQSRQILGMKENRKMQER